MNVEAEALKARSRLAELAQLLIHCRGWYLDMCVDGLLTSAPGSVSAQDLASLEYGPDEVAWHKDLVPLPSSLAVKLLRQQADYLTAMGLLIQNDEVFDPLNTVLRGAFEYGGRAVWILDNYVPHRARCARAVLMELASIESYRLALSDMPNGEEKVAARQRATADWKRFTRLAQDSFHSVIKGCTVSAWQIEMTSYLSWTDLGKFWASKADTSFDGGSMYQLLSVYGHPQGFAATAGFYRLEDGAGIERASSIDAVERRAQLALVSFYLSLTAVANYHGYESIKMSQLEAAMEHTLPDIFTSPHH